MKTRRLQLMVVLALALLLSALPLAVAAPMAVVDDEIAVIEYPSGRIRIDDPSQPPGIAPFTWNSGSEIGWGFIAAGDFNGDGDAELAAIRGIELRVFDPFVQPGFPPVSFVNVLSGGRTYRLLAAGDIDRDGRDELVVLHTEAGGQALQVWDGGDLGTTWSLTRSEAFGGAWDAISIGDMNNDGYDDVALFRNIDQRIKVYNGATWTPPLAETTRDFDWLAMTLGNFTTSFPGDEMALTREDVGSTLNSLVMLRLGTTGLVSFPDPQPDWRFLPYFQSIAAGDVNGDGDDELMMLRDPQADSISLRLINPSGAAVSFEQAIGYGANSWSQVRIGDLDGDARGETVVLRQDRYRIYWQAEADALNSETVGSFRTPSLAVDFDRPTMAIANFDGPGQLTDFPPMNPDNGHYYALFFAEGISWDDASARANETHLNDCQGYLATVTSAQENDFVVANFGAEMGPEGFGFWLGGYQDPGVGPADYGWKWVTGETWGYTNWWAGEPNDAYGWASEQHLTIIGTGLWNDEALLSNVHGYLVECTPGGAIDIKPGEEDNTIILSERGKLPVAVLSTEEFDAPEQMDRASLTFGRTGDEKSLLFRKDNRPNCWAEDVNGDERADLICYFLVKYAGFREGNTEGILKGMTTAGAPFEGRDMVHVVP